MLIIDAFLLLFFDVMKDIVGDLDALVLGDEFRGLDSAETFTD